MSVPGKRRRRPLKVLGGMFLMLAFVAVAFAVLTQFAGNWGVPYFSFTTDRGSTCRNTWTGFRCDQMTLADVNFYADVALPSQSRIEKASYVSTHDYQLDATLVVPAKQAAAALAALKKSFGDCVEDRPSPLQTDGLKDVCVLADDLSDAGGQDAGKASRLYEVGTGLGKNGSRMIALSVRSR